MTDSENEIQLDKNDFWARVYIPKTSSQHTVGISQLHKFNITDYLEENEKARKRKVYSVTIGEEKNIMNCQVLMVKKTKDALKEAMQVTRLTIPKLNSSAINQTPEALRKKDKSVKKKKQQTMKPEEKSAKTHDSNIVNAYLKNKINYESDHEEIEKDEQYVKDQKTHRESSNMTNKKTTMIPTSRNKNSTFKMQKRTISANEIENSNENFNDDITNYEDDAVKEVIGRRTSKKGNRKRTSNDFQDFETPRKTSKSAHLKGHYPSLNMDHARVRERSEDYETDDPLVNVSNLSDEKIKFVDVNKIKDSGEVSDDSDSLKYEESDGEVDGVDSDSSIVNTRDKYPNVETATNIKKSLKIGADQKVMSKLNGDLYYIGYNQTVKIFALDSANLTDNPSIYIGLVARMLWTPEELSLRTTVMKSNSKAGTKLYEDDKKGALINCFRYWMKFIKKWSEEIMDRELKLVNRYLSRTKDSCKKTIVRTRSKIN